jgi:hypothetical protein
MGRRDELEPFVKGWTRTYDGLFKVPVWRSPQFDGTRDVSPTFQKDIDALLDRLLEEMGVTCVPLPAAERDGWITIVLRALGLPEEPPQIELFPGM